MWSPQIHYKTNFSLDLIGFWSGVTAFSPRPPGEAAMKITDENAPRHSMPRPSAASSLLLLLNTHDFY